VYNNHVTAPATPPKPSKQPQCIGNTQNLKGIRFLFLQHERDIYVFDKVILIILHKIDEDALEIARKMYNTVLT